MSSIENFWAVVPAGGAGTRLWPLSRSSSPKFLHDLTGSGRSLLQGTYDRLAPLVDDRFLVVTGRAHRDAVWDQLPDVDDDSVVTEPSARDSMAAIGFAAALLEREHPDVVMGSFAADHVIADPELFGDGVRTAVAAARDDWLVTIGIDPTFPSSAFGYIHLGDELSDHPGVSAVREFVEKPSVEVATEYVASGRYRWNAGMFVVRPRVLLELLAESDPGFTAALREIVAEPSRLEELWPTLPKIALDHAVAEPAAAAGRVVTVPASFGWDDIGDFDSLATILEAAEPKRWAHRARRLRPGPRDRQHRPRRRGRRQDHRGGRGGRHRRGRHPRRPPGHDQGAGPGGQGHRRGPEGCRDATSSPSCAAYWSCADMALGSGESK